MKLTHLSFISFIIVSCLFAPIFSKLLETDNSANSILNNALTQTEVNELSKGSGKAEIGLQLHKEKSIVGQPESIQTNDISETNTATNTEKVNRPGKSKSKERRCKRGYFFHIRGKRCVPYDCVENRNIDTGDCNGGNAGLIGSKGLYRTGGSGTSWHNKAKQTGIRVSGFGRGGKKGR